MWVGVIVVGWGLWLLTSGSKKPTMTPDSDYEEAGNALDNLTEYREVERIPSVSGSGYYCIEQRDYVDDGEVLWSQFRVQVKVGDNDYTISTVFDSLADAQAQVESMNQPPTQEDKEKAEEKGELPDSDRGDNIFSTPEFGGGK